MAEDIVETLPAAAWEDYYDKLQGVSHQIENLGPPVHPVREMGGCVVLFLSKVWLGWWWSLSLFVSLSLKRESEKQTATQPHTDTL